MRQRSHGGAIGDLGAGLGTRAKLFERNTANKRRRTFGILKKKKKEIWNCPSSAHNQRQKVAWLGYEDRVDLVGLGGGT